MRCRRPSNRESIESWANIWLGCMDASFTRHSGGNSSPGTVTVTHKRKAYKSGMEKFGPILAQNSCGHGFTWRDRGTVAQGIYKFAGNRNDEMLGASPRECRTISQHYRKKHGY